MGSDEAEAEEEGYSSRVVGAALLEEVGWRGLDCLALALLLSLSWTSDGNWVEERSGGGGGEQGWRDIGSADE